MSEVRYYAPSGSAPATDGKRFVPNRIDHSSVMARVSRDLYASETAGIRELLANEITAARAARKLGADPRIEVTILPDRICVWGVDSLGMERRIFDDIYTVLGRSGNFDGSTPGQFGFGRAAYVTISDHMLLETRHRNGDKYVALGVEGRGFQVDMGIPDIPYGTRITLVPRDGAPLHGMKCLVERIAGRCEIPITLATPKGTGELGRTGLATVWQFMAADLPDAEFAAGTGNGKPLAFLCGIPIGFTYRGKFDISVAVDIHDERKYMPTPDRERMTEEAEHAISKLIDAEVERHMAGFPADINEAMDHPDRNLACRLGLGPRALHATVNLIGRRRIPITLGLMNHSPVLACSVLPAGHEAAVRARFPDAAFVTDAPDGLTDMSDFMKRHGIRPPPGGKPDKSPPGQHAGEGSGNRNAGRVAVYDGYGQTMVNPEHPPEHLAIYRVDSEDDIDMNSYIMKNRSNTALTAHDVRGAMRLDDMVSALGSHRFATSRGTMTGADITREAAPVQRVRRRALLELWGDGAMRRDDILVLHEGEESDTAFGWLGAVRGNANDFLDIDGWDCEAALEAYLRLESPILRDAMRESWALREGGYPAEFLAMEGKPPVSRDGCPCRCRRRDG